MHKTLHLTQDLQREETDSPGTQRSEEKEE